MADRDTISAATWPSQLEVGDRLFAIVDGSSGNVPYLIYSSKEKKASYARDAGGWHLVGETFFEKLEDQPLFYVENVAIGAISVYDKADREGVVPSILDLSDVSTLGTPATAQARKEADALVAAAIIPEERELAEALIEITQKYGKFNEDDTGVWAGYETAAENENADIGVTCANCILYEGGTSCKILATEVEPGGYCRFALIPDGIVNKRATERSESTDRDLPPKE